MFKLCNISHKFLKSIILIDGRCLLKNSRHIYDFCIRLMHSKPHVNFWLPCTKLISNFKFQTNNRVRP